jgi:hypothetical protein
MVPGEEQLIRMVTVTEAPGGRTTGKLGLTLVKAGLLDVIAIIEKIAAPDILLTVKFKSLLDPMHTSPKRNDAGDTIHPATRADSIAWVSRGG